MKRVFIMHCWEGYPDYCWYPYAKRELESDGFQVRVPEMPDTEKPKLDRWLPKLQKIVGIPDQDTYFIGHSVGCVTIMRYLESLHSEQKVGGVVFVAGFKDDLGFEELKNFFIVPINFEKIKNQAKDFVAIHSDNDPYVPLEHGDVFKDKLGAQLIIKSNAKHFSGASDDEEPCLKLPDVVQAILNLTK